MVFMRILLSLQQDGVVIHAASVGEVIAATPLVKRIQKEYPHLPITFTTVTPTGSERVKAAFGDSCDALLFALRFTLCHQSFY